MQKDPEYPQGDSNKESQATDNKGLSESGNAKRVQKRVQIAGEYSDFEQIKEAWPKLPTGVKKIILDLIKLKNQ